MFQAVRQGERPIVIDSRPAREYDVLRIVGTHSIPAETATLDDFTDIPRKRPVYLLSNSDPDGEAAALKLARLIAQVDDAPKRVLLVRGGIHEVRRGGFMYINDVQGEERLNSVKAEEAKAAAAAAAAAQQKK